MATVSKAAIDSGSGTNVAAYSITEGGETRLIQRAALSDPEGVSLAKQEDSAAVDGDYLLPIAALQKAAPANVAGDGDYALPQMNNGMLWTYSMTPTFDIAIDITRPADTTAYAVGDTLADSTSAPTAGGFSFANAARVSGSSILISDAVITSSASPATPIEGEIWLFNQAITSVADNAPFALSDSDAKFCVGKIAFKTTLGAVNNTQAFVPAVNLLMTLVGSANLRAMVKVTNAYTPASGEVLTLRLKGIQVN